MAADPRSEGPIPAVSQIDVNRIFSVVSDPAEKKLDTQIPKGTQMMAVLKQSPYYPYDPEMGWRHPCSSLNSTYFKCFSHKKYDGWSYHERVAACYSERADLMVCMVKQRKKEKKAQDELEAKLQAEAEAKR